MQPSHLYWPSQRKLFRKRNPKLMPMALLLASAAGLLAAFRFGWF